MPLLKRVRVMGAEIESTAGTAATITAPDAAFNVFNAMIQPNIEWEDREGQGAFSHLPGVPGQRAGTATFQIEVTGDGAGGVPAWASTFLPACGWVNTMGTFSPSSEAPGSNVKTVTLGLFENGLYKQLHGAVGTFVITMPSRRRVLFDFTFQGIYSAPTDVAIIAPTYPTTAPFIFHAETLTLASWVPVLEQITIDAGNEVILREDATQSSGILTGLITGRKVTGTMNPEAVLVAACDHAGKWLARTEEALTVELDNGTDRVTFAAPKAQRTDIQEGDRNSNQTDEITFQCNRSASAGGDEFTIAFAATD